MTVQFTPKTYAKKALGQCHFCSAATISNNYLRFWVTSRVLNVSLLDKQGEPAKFCPTLPAANGGPLCSERILSCFFVFVTFSKSRSGRHRRRTAQRDADHVERKGLELKLGNAGEDCSLFFFFRMPASCGLCLFGTTSGSWLCFKARMRFSWTAFTRPSCLSQLIIIMIAASALDLTSKSRLYFLEFRCLVS